MTRDRSSVLRRSVVAIVALACLGGQAWLRPALIEKRRVALGTKDDAPPPPDVAVAGVALGAFRGLVVDYLWLRAMRLEDEGKFFEALELARWIGKLEPRLEQVWSFQAHALAYNLSAACDDPKQRWLWVQNGIKLLRDDGLRLNPRAPELYFMLSRIYSDKIGGPFDDWHLFLKKSLAESMVPGFGPLGEAIDLEALAAGADEVSRARAKWLRDEQKLEPAKLVEIDRKYGPLDWRSCDAHALYWAVEGARVARGLGPKRAAREERRLERLAISAVKNAATRGRTIVQPDGATLFAQEPRLVTRVIELYDEAIARAKVAEERGEAVESDDDEDDDGHHHEKADTRDQSAALYRNSLEDARKEYYLQAILILAQYGREAEAKKVYATLGKRHPAVVDKPYDEYVGDLFRMEVMGEGGDILDQKGAYRALLGAWTRAWTALALGNDEHALGLIALADRVYRERQRFVERAVASGDEKALQRLGTIELPKIKRQAYDDLLLRLSPALRVRLEERAAPLLAPSPTLPRSAGEGGKR